MGLVLLTVLRHLFRSSASSIWKYFFLHVASVSMFIGFLYPAWSGIVNVGDFKDVIAMWPHSTLIRICEVALGTAACAYTVRLFAPYFAQFPESLWRLVLIPYFASAAAFCIAGLRLHNAIYYMAISVVPASLLGQAILPITPPIARRIRAAGPQFEAIPFNPIALVLALIFVVITLLTVPGVHFTIL
jgi:uncharacterized protein YggT (Ycf19 family)